jgi:hypothetical protein
MAICDDNCTAQPSTSGTDENSVGIHTDTDFGKQTITIQDLSYIDVCNWNCTHVQALSLQNLNVNLIICLRIQPRMR